MSQPPTNKTWSDKYLTIQTVAGMLSFVFGAGLLYGEFKGMKIKASEAEKEFNVQIELQEKRSDTRFIRATEWNLERKLLHDKLEERVRALERELAFERGKTSK
jgi:hypothetical protein